MSNPAGTLGPRSLLATLTAFASLTVVVVLVSLLAGAPGRSPTRPTLVEAGPPDAGVLAFFAALADGERFDGWSIARIDGPRAGGLPLVLRGPEDQRVAVELRPRDDRSPVAPAASDTLAIYVLDRDMPRSGLAGVLALARALRSREAAGARLEGLEPLLFAR